MLFQTVLVTANKLKNKAVLSLKQYCVCRYLVLNNIIIRDSNYFK